MGNSIGGKRKGAKVMKLDGTVFRVKPPSATAAAVLRDHPGHHLLESEEVKLLGVRARPLAPDATLKPGRLYFLVQLPRTAATPRRAWSGSLQVGARERLESLLLTRRSTSDLSLAAGSSSPFASAAASPVSSSSSSASAAAAAGDSPAVRLKMRLPREQVAKVMEESRDTTEAAKKIMELCVSGGGGGASVPRTPERTSGILRTPERSPRFLGTPENGCPMFARTPERWTPFMRTPERASPDVKAGRKEKRTRFVALPDEIIA